MKRQSSRHALVCGASMGIGEAAAHALAAAGHEITLLARNEAALKKLTPVLAHAGSPRVHVLAANLDERDAVAERLRAHLEALGTIHILINNTGGPPHGPILDAGPDDFLRAFSRHVLSAHTFLQICLPGMRADGFGRVINVVSTSVYEPIPGLGVSNTTRAAMAGWAKSVAMELPPGVTINNVLPGFTDTERLAELKGAVARTRGVEESQVEAEWLAQIPEARLGRPTELGTLVAFLASEEASYIRGQSIAIDGGKNAQYLISFQPWADGWRPIVRQLLQA